MYYNKARNAYKVYKRFTIEQLYEFVKGKKGTLYSSIDLSIPYSKIKFGIYFKGDFKYIIEILPKSN